MARAAEKRRRVLVLAGLALGAVALATVTLPDSGSYRVTAIFDQVNGLVEGAEARAAGVKVGSVSSIELGDDGLPRVELEVDDDYRLAQGATATIRAASAAGQVNRFVSLVNGDGGELDDGATIGLALTEQPVEVEQVLSTLDPDTREDVQKVLGGLAGATSGHGRDLRRSLANSAVALGATADLARQIDADGEALRAAVEDGGTVVAALANRRDRLASVAERIRTVLGVTARRQAELALAVERLPQGLARPRAALERLTASVPALRELVAVAGPGVQKLGPFAESLRPALAAARPALAEASTLAGEAPSQLSRLEPLVADAELTLRTLAPTLSSAGPILDEARVRTPDFFSFFANWADFTSVYDANGHAARVGLVLPPGPTNVIGPSDSGAGSLAEPFVRTPGVLEGEPWEDYRDSFIGGEG